MTTAIIDGGNAYRLGRTGTHCWLEGAAVLVDGAVDDNWYIVDQPDDIQRATAIFDALKKLEKEEN